MRKRLVISCPCGRTAALQVSSTRWLYLAKMLWDSPRAMVR